MRVFCNSQDNKDLDRFVGKDLWVKVMFPLKGYNSLQHVGYARINEIVDLDDGDCYYFEFIRDYLIDEETGQFNTSRDNFEIMLDEYCVEISNIEACYPREVYTTDELVNFEIL